MTQPVHRWRAVVDFLAFPENSEPERNPEVMAARIRGWFEREYVIVYGPDVMDQDAMRARLETPFDG